MSSLEWNMATSADKGHDDVEADLNDQAGAAWADVTQDRHHSGKAWTWHVYSEWLHDEGRVIAMGGTDSQEAGKAAVEAWIAAFTKEAC